MAKKSLNIYKFNTTIDYYNQGKIIIVKDICKHYNLNKAILNVIKYNEDRGHRVIRTELQ